MQSQVRVPEKVPGSLAAKPSQVQWVPEKVPEKACRARSDSTRFRNVSEKVPEKVWEALVQSQVRFNRVPEKLPEKVPEKVPGSLGAETG